MKKRLLYVGALLTTVLVNAQQKQDSTKVVELEEVVVTDSRFKLKRENSGKTVIKITEEELQRNQGRTLAEVINTKSGIEINGTRSNGGQNLTAFIRGGNNRQVLILIDGIQVSDPSSVNNSYDLRLIDLSQVASVEIIKGAASTLYGNRAATAVINISTKKASSKKIAATFSSNIGTNQSATKTDYDLADFNNTIGVNGSLGKFNYVASFGHQYSDGLSAVASGNEKDAFSKTAVGINLGYTFSDKFNINVYANQDRFTADFDSTFPGYADAFDTTDSDQYRYGISSNYNYTNGSVVVNASHHRIDRAIRTQFPSFFSGKSWVVDAYNKYNFNDKFYTIVGLNYINRVVDFFNEDEEATTIDPYINVVWVSDFGLNLNIGGRLNNHSEYGSHFTYNINPSYTHKFDDNYIKLLGSYSTSFITPNLSQLFGPFGPNPNLEPEENTTLEGGLEIKLSDKLRISTVYFDRKEENFIDYIVLDFTTFDGEYQNVVNDFDVNGVEVELASKITDQLNLNANYTFTEKKDVAAVRIPKHKVNANLNYNFGDKNYVGLNYQFVGERDGLNFEVFPSELTLGTFSLFDVNFGHELMADRLFFSASVNNIFNKNYTEVFGFSTRGRNFRVGFRLNF